MRMLLLSLLVGLPSIVSAEVDSQSGNYLFGQCEIAQRIHGQPDGVHTRREFLSEGFCLGFLQAAMQSAVLNLHACAPTGVVLDQAIEVWMNWAAANPDKLHQPSYLLTTLALVAAWPCEEKKATPTRPLN